MPSACLTPQVIRNVACPTEKNKIRIYDTKLKGLFLQIRKSGTKSYFLRYRNTRGRNIELKIGDAADLTPVQVRKKAAKLRSQIAMGDDPLAERNVYKNIPSFEQFARDNYLPYIKNYKKSWQTDETLLRIYLIPILGNKYLDEITKDDIIDIQQDGIKRGAAPASTNRLVILLRYMFNLGLKWKTPGVTDNPTKDVPLLVENNQRERFLTKEETKALYEAILQSGNPMLKFIIPMLILTGARKREVLDAKWEDFDFKRKIWCIAMTKSGKARYIPLSDGVLNLLAEIPRTSNSEYVFANPDTGKPFNSIYRSWNTARNQAGLSEVRMHDLRHSFASFLINSGRSLYEVQKLLGHSQIQTTQRYAHLSQETLLEATNMVSDSLFKGGNNQKAIPEN